MKIESGGVSPLESQLPSDPSSSAPRPLVTNYKSFGASPHITGPCLSTHTNSTGSAELNQTLSEKRANAVMDYLVSQGLEADALSAKGYGTSNPMADNSTSQGRQKNRRVEIVISGEVIGAQIGAQGATGK
jgi:hypothetical protein